MTNIGASNGLLRQYLPRRLDFRTLTQTDLSHIAWELNGRPRQTLGFKTPSEALNDACADRLNPPARHDASHLCHTAAKAVPLLLLVAATLSGIANVLCRYLLARAPTLFAAEIRSGPQLN